MHVVARVETSGTQTGDYTTKLVDFTRASNGKMVGTSSWKTPDVADVTAGAAFNVLLLLQKARK